MTCVVAIAEKGKVYIGADSAGVSRYDLIIRADEKVFKKCGFVFGFTSSFRMGQILRYSLKIPDQPLRMPDDTFMHTLFIDAVRKSLKDCGYTKINENRESAGTFIIGFNGKIYTVYDDFQISQPVDQFSACGCGEPYAKAVLYVIRNNTHTPRQRILKALGAAEHFSVGVRGPFRVISA